MSNRRVDIRAILSDPALKAEIIAGVVDFCCKLEGHDHDKALREGPAVPLPGQEQPLADLVASDRGALHR